MIDIFILKILLSFVVGVIWITTVTFIAEKLGTRLGGAIAGIPATMVVSLFFIGWTQTPKIASESTILIPFIVGINALFVVSYVLLSRYNLAISLFASLCGWFILTYILLNLNITYLSSVIGFICTVGISYIILEKKLKIRSQGKKSVRKSIKQVFLRGIISGSVISFAVFMAKISGPAVGGVFASFPAMTVALILISHINHGAKYTSALLKNFIISGTINVLLFVSVIRYSYLFFGLMTGTLISFLISLISAFILYNLINKRMV
ncbi:DUF3147 family protein [Candidatus Woesearchaeota archaeon]|nr:DUF3147 family protein [Candidatus Woesearchaeota archaeon]